VTRLLLVTDFSYPAKGRDYFREDVELSIFLRKHFRTLVCHIDDCFDFLDSVDVIMLRNTGPQATHVESLAKLRARNDLVLFNDLKGKGDINGKTHLLELYKAGYPVIPSFSTVAEAAKYPHDRYLAKPLNGADSIGVQIMTAAELPNAKLENYVVQPLLDFEYEVSFYFVNDTFQYALFAPHADRRWELELYKATSADLEFAKRFADWNTGKVGIQRVDACRLKTGELMLMELEDYNPFLSIDLLPAELKEKFLDSVAIALKKLVSR